MPKAYELPAAGDSFDPELFKLGAPCKRNHIHADGMTLRWRKRKVCPLCERIDALVRQNKKRRDPDFRRKQAEYVAEKRRREGREYRGKHSKEWHMQRRLHAAINRSGRCPSVAVLVYRQQLAYWRTHPADYAAYKRLQAKLQARWRHLTDPSYRLYHRAKAKARKVAQRGGTPLPLSPTHLWRHWGRFEYCCAYCGCSSDLEVEHVVPISKGGGHHLGNIVPACHRCNSSKRSHDALQWYRTCTYYSEARWHKIQLILEQARPTAQQLMLFAG